MLRFFVGFVVGALCLTAGFFAKSYLSSPPQSAYVSGEAVTAAASIRENLAPHMLDLMTGDITQRRAILDQYFFAPKIALARKLYPVTETVLEIDGVYTEIFEPADGVEEHKQDRILINLHGGGFSMGARTEGRLESIPVAHLSGIKVISVDYRQGPEHRFPAASEDVVTVYRHLLKTYQPQKIAIFGCSAGGLLTAQALAWMQAENLPMPGAAGIFCAGAGNFGQGDSVAIADLFNSSLSTGEIAYFEGADWASELVAPLGHDTVMKNFPPTLLISSTRDFSMSSTLVTHQRLVELGVETDLHVYEGLNHYFFADTELTESRHAFEVMARFFNQHLTESKPSAPNPLP